ncbi:probable protein phosphatase 2C 48 isoform X1 [Rutidosis leptorrhynchoides]|uniref:probable protein phosphatase 2C 48 isoform X1 n=1 Tax=Rutidosis leptorrhynchoides TaxID=125765 RepID=UPI003A9925B1
MGKDTFKKFLYTCWKPSVNEEKEDGKLAGKTPDSGGVVNGIWWYKDYGKHVNGEFSMAMVEANAVLEDQCQLESGSLSLTDNGPRGTFVGVYDGHAGYEVARFINNRLFENIKKYTTESQEMSGDVIVNAFLATDDEFISLVESEWKSNPKMASVGSCCLVGIVCNGVLYIANAGDSRAVLAREDKAVNALKAVRVSEEHNASFVSVREELRALHPNDPNIVVLKHNVWRVRGLIQVSRSIGDAYLKKTEFNKPPLFPKFIQSEPFSQPILKAEPSISELKLTPDDQFLIFASDGLWDHLSDQEAVDIVKSSPRDGVARRLVKAALSEAAKKLKVSYSDLEKVGRGLRRKIHDDITVIVLFLNGNSVTRSSSGGLMISVKSPAFFGNVR